MKTLIDLKKEVSDVINGIYQDIYSVHISLSVELVYHKTKGVDEKEPEIKYRLYITVRPSKGREFEFNEGCDSWDKLFLIFKAKIIPMKDLNEIGI